MSPPSQRLRTPLHRPMKLHIAVLGKTALPTAPWSLNQGRRLSIRYLPVTPEAYGCPIGGEAAVSPTLPGLSWHSRRAPTIRLDFSWDRHVSKGHFEWERETTDLLNKSGPPGHRPHTKAIFGSWLEKLCTGLAAPPWPDIRLVEHHRQAIVNLARQRISIRDDDCARGHKLPGLEIPACPLGPRRALLVELVTRREVHKSSSQFIVPTSKVESGRTGILTLRGELRQNRSSGRTLFFQIHRQLLNR
jgi:hypothetical protein